MKFSQWTFITLCFQELFSVSYSCCLLNFVWLPSCLVSSASSAIKSFDPPNCLWSFNRPWSPRSSISRTGPTGSQRVGLHGYNGTTSKKGPLGGNENGQCDLDFSIPFKGNCTKKVPGNSSWEKLLPQERSRRWLELRCGSALVDRNSNTAEYRVARRLDKS